MCQLPVVIGKLVGQYAQLIWVGGGFGDLPMEEGQTQTGPAAGQASSSGSCPAWVRPQHHCLLPASEAEVVYLQAPCMTTVPLLIFQCRGLSVLSHSLTALAQIPPGLPP